MGIKTRMFCEEFDRELKSISARADAGSNIPNSSSASPADCPG
jgi:hypothetical protein